MASVRKRTWTGSDGKPCEAWVVEYTDATGKRRRATPKTGLKKDADALKRKIEREMEDGVHVARSETITVGEALDYYMGLCAKRVDYGELSKSTLGTYRTAAKQVRKIIGGMKLTEVKHETAQEMVDALAATYAPTTVFGAMLCLWQTLDVSVIAGFIKVNPVRLKRLTMPRRHRGAKIPTRAELEHVLAVSGERKKNEQERTRVMRHAMFCLALFSTLRRGEVCGLRWTDVDLERGVLRIRQSRGVHGVKGPKTAAGVRAAPLPQIVIDALAAMPEPRGEYVFARRSGALPNPGNMHLHWYYLADKAGLSDRRPGQRFGHGKPRYRFHDMRHAAASLMIAEGANPLHVQRAMGHASVTTTLGIYGHLFDGDDTIRKASDDISARFLATKTRQGLLLPPQAAVK